MTIKEVEEKTGLARSNIRYYEKEKLIKPNRNQNNGYRDYSKQDVDTIKKIAYLRTLNISLDAIKKIIKYEVPLLQVVEFQYKRLDEQIAELQLAKTLCGCMLQDRDNEFDSLEIERYVDNLNEHWNKNKVIFKIDAVGFVSMVGGLIVWSLLFVISFIAAICSYPLLPTEIPIQWSGGKAVSFVIKEFIFAYPLACIIIRVFLKPFICRWLHVNGYYNENIANYLSNFLCFIALSIEGFTIFFILGILKNITVILAINAVTFIGILFAGWNKFYVPDSKRKY